MEITYQNVKEGPISDVVLGFDIAGCAIAATWKEGRVVDSYISERALGSARQITRCTQRLATIFCTGRPIIGTMLNATKTSSRAANPASLILATTPGSVPAP